MKVTERCVNNRTTKRNQLKSVNNDKTQKITEYQYKYGQRLSGNSRNINMTQIKGNNEVINEQRWTQMNLSQANKTRSQRAELGPVSERRLSENSEYVNPEMRETLGFPFQNERFVKPGKAG